MLISLTITVCFFVLPACSNTNTTKANESKADSLEQRTKYLMDSANDATMKQINSIPDSSITNEEE